MNDRLYQAYFSTSLNPSKSILLYIFLKQHSPTLSTTFSVEAGQLTNHKQIGINAKL